MKKVRLILGIAFLTSMTMDSFAVSAQTFGQNTNVVEEKKHDFEEQRVAEKAVDWDEANSLNELKIVIGRLSPSSSFVSQHSEAAKLATDMDKPLRFVLIIGMKNLPGDKVNPTCYSNIITRPGPPGWGEKGWLPAGSVEQARQAVESYKQQFITACERSGRKITGIGNFAYVWNQYEDGEERILQARARNQEDVTVKLE